MKNKLKFLCVVGTRPNFVKIAPLFEEFKNFSKIECVLVHTGQHYDHGLSPVFFQELSIPKPDYNLGVGSGSHAEQTGRIMIEFEKICIKENPDLVVVVGDVNSTLAGALVAAKLRIPVAHIEAGLRSYDKSIPEEVNRVLVDNMSDFLFCPTKSSVENLKNERIINGVYLTGDITYDTFINYLPHIDKSKVLVQLGLNPRSYHVVTVHRAVNTNNINNLKSIFEALSEISKDTKVVVPLHPRTKKQLEDNSLFFPSLRIIGPLSYIDMLMLEKNAKMILTDSSGVQKEAYFLKVPCITLRKKTEWMETVKDGWNILVGTDRSKIIKAVSSCRQDKKQSNHFGDGKTAQKIVRILVDCLQNKDV